MKGSIIYLYLDNKILFSYGLSVIQLIQTFLLGNKSFKNGVGLLLAWFHHDCWYDFLIGRHSMGQKHEAEISGPVCLSNVMFASVLLEVVDSHLHSSQK